MEDDRSYAIHPIALTLSPPTPAIRAARNASICQTDGLLPEPGAGSQHPSHRSQPLLMLHQHEGYHTLLPAHQEPGILIVVHREG